MLNIVVCIKQVPMVTELPWDEKTGTLRRDLAAGMMNPACKRAVEAVSRGGGVNRLDRIGSYLKGTCRVHVQAASLAQRDDDRTDAFA